MPKHKRAKHKHGHSSNDQELSHQEVWDDSALIRSWDDAVAEYEYYHSIHARGEDVEEILRKAEEAEMNGEPIQVSVDASYAVAAAADCVDDEEAEDGEIDDFDQDDHADDHEDVDATAGYLQSSSPQKPLSNKTASGRVVHGPFRPGINAVSEMPSRSALTTRVDGDESGKPKVNPRTGTASGVSTQGANLRQDQTLENIKMAYYWAGYYSGLYDGQRQPQGQQQQQQQDQPGG